MNLPKDPILLFSVINTKLRDEYESLTELCKAAMVSEEEIIERLAAINYKYDREQNQFI